MHNFNLGFGGDLCASGLFTLCELKIFPGRKLQARLDFAHDRFESWCGEHRKTPQVKSFDKKKFKYKTCLVLSFSIKPFLHINMDIIYPPRPVLVFCGPGPLEPLRKKTFPQGTGRALLCKWLDWELDQLDLGDYDPWVVEKIQVVPCTILEFWISLKFGIPSLNIITVRPIYGIYIYTSIVPIITISIMLDVLSSESILMHQRKWMMLSFLNSWDGRCGTSTVSFR